MQADAVIKDRARRLCAGAGHRLWDRDHDGSNVRAARDPGKPPDDLSWDKCCKPAGGSVSSRNDVQRRLSLPRRPRILRTFLGETESRRATRETLRPSFSHTRGITSSA